MEKTIGGIRLKFSVLIPVYNTEKYLEECLHSVLNQTYQDFEIVIVDDGSTDNSSVICDKYQNSNPNKVKVIHQQNQGQLASRCNAIQAASGEYVIFIDADDLLIENALETINQRLVAYQKPDMLVYSFYYESDNGSKRKADKLFEEGSVDLSEVKKLFFTGTGMNNVWTKAVKREVALCNGFDFSPFFSLRCAEDKFHSMVMVDVCKTVAYIYEPLYQYRLFYGSTTRTYNASNINKYNTSVLYSEEKEYLLRWGLNTESWFHRFQARQVAYLVFVFDLFYMNVKRTTRPLIFEYQWGSFLPKEIDINEIKKNDMIPDNQKQLVFLLLLLLGTTNKAQKFKKFE